MRTFGSLVCFALCHLRASSTGLSKSELAKLDGHLLVGNAVDETISIFPRDKTSWTKDSALWHYKLEKGKDGLHQAFDGKINEVKRVVNSKGQVCLLIVAHGPGLALYNMETGKFDFSLEPRNDAGKTMATHSAELLPDGNFAVADPDDGGTSSILILKGDDSTQKVLDSVSFAGIHGVVWDRKRELLWAWGGQLKHYTYKDGKLSNEKKIANKPDWAHGGHDLAAMDNEDKLIFTSGGGIGTYDINKDEFALAYDVGSGKGIAYDHESKELAFCRQDSGTMSFRTYQIRNPEKPKWVFSPHDEMAMYKARWFRDSPFSYPPSQSPTPSPTPSPSPSPTPSPSPSSGDTLPSKGQLESGEKLVSASGRSKLSMQTGGNLKFFVDGSSIWSSNTGNHAGAYLVFQASGPKLVVRDTDGLSLWSSEKVAGGTKLVVKDDDLVITDDNGNALASVLKMNSATIV